MPSHRGIMWQWEVLSWRRYSHGAAGCYVGFGPMPSFGARRSPAKEQPSEDARDGEGQEDGQTGVHQRPDQNLGRGGHQERENRAE